MAAVTDSLEDVWSQHVYPGHMTFVGQWSQDGMYFRVLKDEDTDTLLLQSLYPALSKAGQCRIALEGRHPDSEIVFRTIKEAALSIMWAFKEAERQRHHDG